jgi:hypothetical protein
MKKIKSIFYCMAYISMFILILSVSNAFGAGSLLPDDLEIRQEYKNGVGASVGSVRIVRGRAVVMHKGEKHGYLLERNTPLFNGDYIVTEPGARARLSMKDGSEITMTPGSKFTINRSSYDKNKKRFSSFFKVTYGKLRFRVMKLVGRDHAYYRVKTPTMTCGVRGSDFSVEVDESGNTVLSTFEETEVEAWNTKYPEDKVFLGSWQQTEVREEDIPTTPVSIPDEDREPMKREFEIGDEGDTSEGESKPMVELEPGEPGEGEDTALTGVLVPEERLLEPDAILPSGPDEAPAPETPDMTDIKEFTEQETDTFDQQIEIQETIKEQEVITELPDFPHVPEYRDIDD